MKNKYIILALFGVLIASCKENVALEYENDPALYFVHEQYVQQDSINHSFFFIPGNEPDTVYVEVQTMGYLGKQDRPFLLEQTNSGDENAAIPGVHYVAFSDPDLAKHLVIPAHSERVSIPIILLRDESLNLKEIRLSFQFVQNDYFRPGIPEWSEFLITTTAQAVKPDLWDNLWYMFFGSSWGSVKMKFIIDATGITDWETRSSDLAFYMYIQKKVLTEFQNYNLANPNNPLREADGTLVSFTQ